jgi:VWFA-related protein
MICRWLANVLILVALEAFSIPGQISTITVKTQEVRVDVLVIDGGKPVQGLKAADFEVFDNGVRQEIAYAGQEDIPFNAVLALDLSDSVAGSRLFNLKNAVGKFLDALKGNERATLMTFNNAIALVSSAADDVAQLKASLNRVRPMGNTSLIDASYAALMVSESHPGRPLMILFSDGLDTSSWLKEESVIYVARRCDAVVYAISMGLHPKITFLDELTRSTGGGLFKVESNIDLGRLFLEILEEFRHRYLVTYSLASTPKVGWHELEVRVKGRKVKIKARPGYYINAPGRTEIK